MKKCIRSVTGRWIMNNIKHKVNTKDGEIPYYEYLLRNTVDIVIEERKKYVDDDSDRLKSIYGYTNSDIDTLEFRKSLYDALSKHIPEMLDYLRGKDSYGRVEVPLGDGKVVINDSTMDKLLKKQVKFLNRVSPKYKQDIIDEIKKTSSENGISKDNYSFDINALKLLVQKEREELSRENTRQTREITQEKRLVRNNYKPMTDEEILQARRKIGLI